MEREHIKKRFAVGGWVAGTVGGPGMRPKKV